MASVRALGLTAAPLLQLQRPAVLRLVLLPATATAAWQRRPGSAPVRGIGGVRHTEGVRLVQTSPGLIVDKFVPIPRSAMPSLFSRVGLALRWANVKGLVRSTVSVARLRQRLPGWKPIPFAAEVEKMFQDMNKAFATGNKTALKSLVTDKVYTELKGEMKQHDAGKAAWQHAGFVERARIVHARVIPLQDKKTEFAQVTVRLHSRQTLATPSGERTRESLDFIVVESTITAKSPWRICGRLNPKWAALPPAAAPSSTP